MLKIAGVRNKLVEVRFHWVLYELILLIILLIKNYDVVNIHIVIHAVERLMLQWPS